MPSSFWKVAFTGHTFTQGGFSQCTQGLGIICAPSSRLTGSMFIQLISVPENFGSSAVNGTLFSTWHATTQEPQPEQRSRSMAIPHFAFLPERPVPLAGFGFEGFF